MTRIVPITPEHRDDWERLYAAYAAFYKVEQTPEMRARVWGWLQDPDHEVTGFLALDDRGKPIALAHFRPFARPLAASTGGFFDDLFVDPQARGSGAAQAIFAAIAEEGRKRGWSVIRWITAEDNYRARSVYDRVGTKTKWVTYDIPL
ncbi:MAG TPA: GNAT family N-acetyltransferase [Geminicoccus sp.]|uniref:GNAT family N-acetyltransferase n=1 Tax=Geminicoccus sp. TaxID=2024832 RepID=UPI002CFCE033|nr:GNAT family N-acetyltransferase [Geminicoccus sp.]HWL70925.1 GNAT family N-acetyltransferase [Geminicoccus sp.]